ncbi:hypothetical protein ACHAXA_010275 [Cyclostephanos tholiformis]|uniref:Uncharacterized protein n=1 Tax=Cyclostephanos tholiformis TaxID=382380 RepID=A0ABD3RDB0_9STRA
MMGLPDRIKNWPLSGVIKERISPKRFKSRRTSAHVKDKPPVFIVTSKPNGADDENAKHHGRFVWLIKNHAESVQEVVSNAGGEGDVAESTVVVHTTGPAWMRHCTANIVESGGDDSKTCTAAQEAASDAGNEGRAPDSALNTLERVLCCMGWGSSHQMGEQTCENSNIGGASGDNSSCGSSGSYDDDERSGETWQPDVSRLDQVLTLSAMADDMSDISLSDSEADDSDDDSHDRKS